MDKQLDQHTRTRRLDLSGLGMLIGPFLGFFGPLLIIDVADRMVAYPSEKSVVLGFALPLLLVSILTAAPSTRRWGWWLLAGVAIGEVFLVALVLLAFSGL